MTSLTQQLQEAQDDQRDKSLDLREAALAEREQLLDDSSRITHIEELDAQIAILNSQIDIRQNNFTKLQNRIPAIEETVRTAAKQASNEISKIQQAVIDKKIELDDINNDITKVEKNLVDVNNQLEIITGDIKEREEYLENQRKIVDETIADWNIQLTGFHQEGERITEEKKRLNTDLIHSKQQQQTEQDALDALLLKLERLQELYEQKLGEHKEALTNAKKTVLDKESELSQIDGTIQLRLQALATREESLKVREKAVQVANNNLRDREQALNMKLNMIESQHKVRASKALFIFIVANWTTKQQPFGPNRAPVLVGTSATDGVSPIPVAVNPATGAIVVSGGGSGGGDVQYASGTTTPSPVTGNAIIFDASGTLQNVSTSNPLPITGTISVGSTTDESTFTAGSSTTGPIAGVFNDSVTTLMSGQQGTIRATTNRGLHINIRNAAGTEIGTPSTPIRIDPTGTTTQPVSGTITAITNALPAGTNVIGHVIVDSGSTTVVTGTVTTKEQSSTSAVTSVASSGTTISLLVANTNRRDATFYNDSTQILYLKLGATASTTSYTVQMAAGSYYEVPQPCYTGAIDGIWASANGSVRITEIST